jgi:hypothetical protein
MRQDHLCLRICCYKFLSEEYRRHVGHALAVPEQLVEFSTPIWLALPVVLCFQSFHPHLIVAWILKERLPAVVALVDSQQAKCSACCYLYYISGISGTSWWYKLTFSRRPTHSQHQHLHGYCSLAILLPVDVCNYTGVVCEVSWLRHNFCFNTVALDLLVGVVSDTCYPVALAVSSSKSVDRAMHHKHSISLSNMSGAHLTTAFPAIGMVQAGRGGLHLARPYDRHCI